MRCRLLRINLIGLLILVFLPSPLFSQINESWIKRYNGTGNGDDNANVVITDSHSNIYVTGGGIGVNSYDYVTIKYNSSGDTVWIRRYSGMKKGCKTLKDYNYYKTKGFTRGGGATAIAVDLNRNVYVTGSDWDGVDNKFDYVTF